MRVGHVLQVATYLDIDRCIVKGGSRIADVDLLLLPTSRALRCDVRAVYIFTDNADLFSRTSSKISSYILQLLGGMVRSAQYVATLQPLAWRERRFLSTLGTVDIF